MRAAGSAQSNLQEAGYDPGGQQGFSKLCCVSPFYPISLPFSSNLEVKALRVKALKASMTQYHKHKCLLPFEILSGNRVLNFILGNTVFLLKTKQCTPERALLS